MSRRTDGRRPPGANLPIVRAFSSPDPSIINTWGEPVQFSPKVGGGPFDVVMVHSTQVPDPDVQPPPLMVLFGTMDRSGFVDAGAPYPLRGDTFVFDGVSYECYLVKQDGSGGTFDTNGTWIYLTQEGG